MELRLPAPSVLVLIGPSSAGKTTWAHEHFDENEVVSSDALRAMVGIDNTDQAAGTVAFDILDQVVAERTRRRLTTVVDTTGLDSGNRARWIALAHTNDLPIHAIIFDVESEVLMNRNSARARPLPKAALTRQMARFKTAVGELGNESFDGVHRVQPVAVVPPQIAEDDREPAVAAREASHTFGLIVSRFDWPEGDLADQLADVARRAETAGFRDIWLMDHFRQIRGVGQPWEDILEAYTTLGYLAAVTERVRLGAMVTGITHRNPTVLGKMVATLDVLSRGRAICGLGAAWDEPEHAAYGISFPDLTTRYALLEDTLEMLPLLWGKGSPSFEGRTFAAAELICYPRPVQEHIPILVGGGGEKKTLRLVAEHADMANVFGSPDVVAHKVAVLEQHCEASDRDPTEIEVSHLTTALVADSRRELRSRIHQLRGRNTTVEDYARRNNAGTIEDLVGLFTQYDKAGASHSIVALPDVTLPGSIEAFGGVIAALASP